MPLTAFCQPKFPPLPPLVRYEGGIPPVWPTFHDHGGVLGKETCMTRRRVVWLAVIVMSSSVAWQVGAEDAPPLRHLRVNCVGLSYVDQGTGTSVVFIHGAFSHLRIWEPQRAAVARSYRFIAYNQRDHGPEPWPDEGQHYSTATHAADLAAFLDALQAGPAHLVAHSSSG